ncbi:hypothetical protein GQ44DRAFT_355182 [Phaeosphaeriaceae sp. PMI808]|nr:hypothetical protein GQ44DRAFT_355182 [Phaeosphaeriaceae sp. PMI808]
MSGNAKSSTAVGIFRNDDPLSLALRDGTACGIDDIARLNRAVSPVYAALSSLGTSSMAVFSSHEESTLTQPTSTGTNYLSNLPNDKGKGKCKVSYASSLSGTHGSASEVDIERKVLRRDNLLAMGDWADNELEHSRPLKGTARAKERQQPRRKGRHKKPVVVVEQNNRVHSLSETCTESVVVDESMATSTPPRNSTDKKYLRHRTLNHDDDPVQLAEQGHVQPVTSPGLRLKPLSRTRVYVLVGVIFLMVMTLAVATISAHVTGKARMSCTKGIVFAATASLAFLTVLALLVARRALSEALLAGLLEFVFGFALLVELDDFM